jgi:hypothetical protein
MRRIQPVLLWSSIFVSAYLLLNLPRVTPAAVPANGHGAGVGALRNGDVDCDGRININDPLVTLRWLFMDGPEPCAIAQESDCSDVALQVAAVGEQLAALQASVASLSQNSPPAPDDLVNLRGSTREIAPQQYLEIWSVPEDRVFVITSMRFRGSESYQYLTIDGQKETHPFLYDGHYVSSSGFPVPPGSRIGFTNDQPGPGGTASVTYFITGYLTAAR